MSSLSMQAWIADAAYSRTAARPSGRAVAAAMEHSGAPACFRG